MARNSTRTEKILDAAAHLFANQGYHATSTREIARNAGVSENTLFRYFSKKEELFWATLRSRAAIISHEDSLQGIRAGAPPEVVLPKIFELLTETISNRPEFVRLVAIANIELPAQAQANCKDLLSPFLSELSGYFARSVAKREVLEVDPSLLAAALMAMVLMYPQVSKLTTDNSALTMDTRGAASAYSTFWLNILTPRSSAFPDPIALIN